MVPPYESQGKVDSGHRYNLYSAQGHWGRFFWHCGNLGAKARQYWRDWEQLGAPNSAQ